MTGKKMDRQLILIMLVVLASAMRCLDAAPPRDSLQSHFQPDGLKILLRIRGDELLHWLETEDEYTVVRREDGAYVFASDYRDDKLIGSEFLVGVDDPSEKGIKKGQRPIYNPDKIRDFEDSLISKTCTNIQFPNPRVSFGNLVILAKFSDHLTRTLPTESDIETIFNKPGGDPSLAPTGSVCDVFSENSYGTCEPKTVVAKWISLPKSEFYYSENRGGRGPRELLNKAVRQSLCRIDGTVDFVKLDMNKDGYLDCLSFLHSGYGAEAGGEDPAHKSPEQRIWSQYVLLSPPWTSKTGVKVCRVAVCPSLFGNSGTHPTRIGVLSHEIGHVLRLRDMYDNRQNGNYPPGHGIGNWGIMGNCWGFDQSLLFPPHFSAFSKTFLGWVTPTEISATGSFTIQAVEQTPQIYKIKEGYPAGEYLLIENRQPIGFDKLIPGSKTGRGGLAIWHVDEQQPDNLNLAGYPSQSQWPKFHYKNALLQSDGAYQLEKGINKGDGNDLYRGAFRSTIGPSTVPATIGYQDGLLSSPANTIHNVSASGVEMTFEVTIEE